MNFYVYKIIDHRNNKIFYIETKKKISESVKKRWREGCYVS